MAATNEIWGGAGVISLIRLGRWGVGSGRSNKGEESELVLWNMPEVQ